MILLIYMEEELTQSLMRTRRKSRYSLTREPLQQSPKRYSVRIHQRISEAATSTVISQSLQWQKSQTESVALLSTEPKPSVYNEGCSKKERRKKWYGTEAKAQKTLNEMVFNLKGVVQRKLYVFNYILNLLMRMLFISLLAFLVISNKWVYLQIFLSLWMVVIVMYVIVMLKMIFTKSDRQSVYFAKIFNEAEWTDIQSQRLMRTHFNVKRVRSKIVRFFDPRTKFGKNIKISFLRQEIFKRMELVMVYLPFAVMFFLNKQDFVSAYIPDFKVYITASICLQTLRTTFTYLVIYIYS